MVDSIYSNAASAYSNASKIGSKGSLQSDTKDSVKIGTLPPVAEARLDPVAIGSGDKAFSTKPTFPQLLDQSMDKARGATYKGEETSVQSLVKKAELHEMVTAVTNAELTLKTVVAVRDKVINAYQDIIKMPI